MDSLTRSCDRSTRKKIGCILMELGFKDTPQCRKLDPWMTAVLARQQQQQQPCSPKKPYNLNYKKRPFNDVDSQKNLSFKKQWTCMEPRPGSLKFVLSSPRQVGPVEKELPKQLRNMIVKEMGGSDLLFEMEKALTCTDLNPHHGRLSIPERQVANEFLNIEEKAKVKKGINVKLLMCNHAYQPGSEEIQLHNINLTMWEMASNVYVLNKTWNPIVKEHKLREGVRVQLWAFRVQSELCLPSSSFETRQHGNEYVKNHFVISHIIVLPLLFF